MAEPMYRQIADDLRGKIDSGEIAHGAQLPTEIELMDAYSASRNTVRDAIKLLTTRGMVEPRPGQGTFVVEKINPFVTTLTGDPRVGPGGRRGADLHRGGGGRPEEPRRVRPPGGGATGERGHRRRAPDQGRGPGRRPPLSALHRRRPLLAPDLVLSHEPGPAGCDAADRGHGHTRGDRRLPVRQARGPAGRLPRLDPGTATGPPGGPCSSGSRPTARSRCSRSTASPSTKSGDRVRLTITIYPVDRNRLLDQCRRCPNPRERRRHEWR